MPGQLPIAPGSEKGQYRQPVLPRKKRTQPAAAEGANSLTILKNGREAYVQISVACGCDIGRVRARNEDNIYLNGRTLEQNNRGLKGILTAKYLLDTEKCFAVFDGMGGEQAGDAAAFTAARALRAGQERLQEYMVRPSAFLKQACSEMNDAVCAGCEALPYGRMGTTVAALLFTAEEVYACNLGDSRIYRLRGRVLTQISVDDSEPVPEGTGHGKPPLTQYLGVFPDELTLVPHLVKSALKPGDFYLLCSDGLTDLLPNVMIADCIRQHTSVRQITEHLLRAALQNGGRDNISVIGIKINELR